ncbi:MAG: tRNA (N6-threonylcarbamoyladenosine(37)-N6)-methyltransferase TrmO [Lachnospiraceae bacterium]|nr:tRNA (N6-threonylcarbamoyladenosine(37)-N6)-methyltransferase TrmO [Lachnospiraceae bacterium]
MKIIARIRTDFPTKFGIPRQSGLVPELVGRIVFEPEYRDPEALRGITGYTHLWLVWEFSEMIREKWSPTVRPPRLGGNTRVGVFATRSPNRPNPIGLSSVRLLSVEKTENEGTVLLVSGADLMDGTPIYDIKPYLPLSDCHPDAIGGFSDGKKDYALTVEIPEEIVSAFPADKIAALRAILSEDPRPSYQNDPEREYGFPFAGHEVRFRVSEGVLTVLSAVKQ